MFTAIEVENFRNFEALRMEGFQRVNLFAGRNSVGKTALLEALFLLCGAENAEIPVRLNGLRGAQSTEAPLHLLRTILWDPLFHDLAGDKPATLSAVEKGDGQHIVELRVRTRSGVVVPLDTSTLAAPDVRSGLDGEHYLEMSVKRPNVHTVTFEIAASASGLQIKPPPSAPAFLTVFLTGRRRLTTQEDVQRFGRMEVLKAPYDPVPALQILEPRLKLLKTISTGGAASMLYADVGLERLLPLYLVGDGVGLLASILFAIADSPHGTVLIDEVESGFHYSVVEKVWSAIAATADRFDVQIFATTHSFECIRAAHAAFGARPSYDLGFYRLDWSNGSSKKIEVVSYDREALDASIKADLEVR